MFTGFIKFIAFRCTFSGKRVHCVGGLLSYLTEYCRPDETFEQTTINYSIKKTLDFFLYIFFIQIQLIVKHDAIIIHYINLSSFFQKLLQIT